ncbi:MAG: site-specific integrase, partial [Stomatobaculum sp.]|nr:site-specific integrase [Stomatobaculum sp.]
MDSAQPFVARTSKGDAGGDMMDEELIRFASFLENERQMAKNTLVSYERDLRQMISWMA